MDPVKYYSMPNQALKKILNVAGKGYPEFSKWCFLNKNPFVFCSRFSDYPITYLHSLFSWKQVAGPEISYRLRYRLRGVRSERKEFSQTFVDFAFYSPFSGLFSKQIKLLGKKQDFFNATGPSHNPTEQPWNRQEQKRKFTATSLLTINLSWLSHLSGKSVCYNSTWRIATHERSWQKQATNTAVSLLRPARSVVLCCDHLSSTHPSLSDRNYV